MCRSKTNSDVWVVEIVWRTGGTLWINFQEDQHNSRPDETADQYASVSVSTASVQRQTTVYRIDRLLWCSAFKRVWFHTVSWMSKRCFSATSAVVLWEVKGCLAHCHKVLLEPEMDSQLNMQRSLLWSKRTGNVSWEGKKKNGTTEQTQWQFIFPIFCFFTETHWTSDSMFDCSCLF